MADFIDGLFAKAPHEKAPDFVKCKISIKRKDLGNWLRQRDDEWINVIVKESKEGKWYAQIDDWKPKQSGEQHPENSVSQNYANAVSDPEDPFEGEDIPF